MTTTNQNHVLPLTSDPGRPDRDRDLVRYVGRHGVISIEHAMAALGVGRTAAYRRAAACIEAGLLERLEILRHQPSLLRATRQGLRYAGLDLLPTAKISPGGVDHALRCATVGRMLEEINGLSRVLTEREILAAERLAGEPIASARMHGPRRRRRHARPPLHRPDLAVLGKKGVFVIEVELTPKTPGRLISIMLSWREATWVRSVRYVCEPGPTDRAVRRAVAKAEAGGKISIHEAPR
jgi:hypothetical protein